MSKENLNGVKFNAEAKVVTKLTLIESLIRSRLPFKPDIDVQDSTSFDNEIVAFVKAHLKCKQGESAFSRSMNFLTYIVSEATKQHNRL
jgi:hypothetical protein